MAVGMRRDDGRQICCRQRTTRCSAAVDNPWRGEVSPAGLSTGPPALRSGEAEISSNASLQSQHPCN
jgi:hypothetical protein